MKLPKITALGVSTTVAVSLGAVAFSLSFTALTELAAQNGVASGQAWGFPIIVDGLMVGATAATVAMKNRASRAYAYFALGLGSVLSVAGNVAHAVQNGQGPIGVGIAAIIPVILFVVTHLTVLLAREKFADDSAVSAPTEAPVETPASVEAESTPVKKDLVAVG